MNPLVDISPSFVSRNKHEKVYQGLLEKASGAYCSGNRDAPSLICGRNLASFGLPWAWGADTSRKTLLQPLNKMVKHTQVYTGGAEWAEWAEFLPCREKEIGSKPRGPLGLLNYPPDLRNGP